MCLRTRVLQPTLIEINIQRCPKLKTLNPYSEIDAAFKNSASLQVLVICDCPELLTLPEGVLQPTLQKIVIRRCPKLKKLNQIDKSEATFNGLTSLQVLEIDDCPELITLPARVLQPTLKEIYIQQCPKLKTLNPYIEIDAAFKNSASLQVLVISDFAELLTLPEGVLQPSLQRIDIRGCPKLKQLNQIDKSEATFSGLTSLQVLVIHDCPELITLPARVLQPTLKEIYIQRCPKLKTLDPYIEIDAAFKNSASLQVLVICDFPELLTLPEGVLQPTLQRIDIRRCPKLKMLNQIDKAEATFNGSTSLQELVIYDCPELITLPAWVLQPTLVQMDIYRCPKLKMLNPIDKIAAALNGLTSLRRLSMIDCPELTLPEASFKGLSSLEELSISDFTELTCLPEGVLQPNLIDIRLLNCPKLKTPNPDALRTLTSLKELVIISCSNWGSCWEEGLICTTSLQRLAIGEFGDEYRYFPWPSTSAASPPWCHFTSLEKLDLWGWPEVKSLPDQLEHLLALRYLEILNFSGLESLPEWLGKLSYLESLSILGCPLLGKRCKKGSGEDWHKIAHIPSIEIDGRRIE